MLRAMDSAVAGLRAHQNKLDVIGHNIANVNTFGYKAQVYSFQEAMYQTSSSSTGGTTGINAAGGTNAAQYGYGALTGSISMDMTASTPTYMGGLNASIEGDGFFITSPTILSDDQLPDVENIKATNFDYSRVGQFKLDNNGYLVDAQGNFIYGFRPNIETSTIEITDPTDDTKKVNKTVYDYKINATELVPLRAPTAFQPETYQANGYNPDKPRTITFGDGDVDALELANIQIDKLGRISATIKHPGEDNADDGKTITMGWVAIATFQNPEGLTKTGGYYYNATEGDNTGACSASAPGGSTSTLMSGYLEASNTDLATEFSNMITTQRGFQANSKMITVSDEILNELVNMKR